MGDYQHEWPKYMTTKSLVLTVTAMFLDWRRTRDALGYDPPDTGELVDAMQILWDELWERLPNWRAYDEIFHAPGMDQEALDEFTELLE